MTGSKVLPAQLSPFVSRADVWSELPSPSVLGRPCYSADLFQPGISGSWVSSEPASCRGAQTVPSLRPVEGTRAPGAYCALAAWGRFLPSSSVLPLMRFLWLPFLSSFPVNRPRLLTLVFGTCFCPYGDGLEKQLSAVLGPRTLPGRCSPDPGHRRCLAVDSWAARVLVFGPHVVRTPPFAVGTAWVCFSPESFLPGWGVCWGRSWSVLRLHAWEEFG